MSTRSRLRGAAAAALITGMLAAGCGYDDPEPEGAQIPPLGPVTPSVAPEGPVSLPQIGSSAALSDRQLRRYARTIQRYVTYARAGDCDSAWAMGNKNLHLAFGPKSLFCEETLAAIAYVDPSLGTLEAEDADRVSLALPHSQTISMNPGRGGKGPQIRTTNLGTYERALYERGQIE